MRAACCSALCVDAKNTLCAEERAQSVWTLTLFWLVPWENCYSASEAAHVCWWRQVKSVSLASHEGPALTVITTAFQMLLWHFDTSIVTERQRLCEWAGVHDCDLLHFHWMCVVCHCVSVRFKPVLSERLCDKQEKHLTGGCDVTVKPPLCLSNSISLPFGGTEL